MKIAVISDIHANSLAFDKVMEDIKPEIERLDSEVENLKDIVGEGLVDEEGNRITITDFLKQL